MDWEPWPYKQVLFLPFHPLDPSKHHLSVPDLSAATQNFIITTITLGFAPTSPPKS